MQVRTGCRKSRPSRRQGRWTLWRAFTLLFQPREGIARLRKDGPPPLLGVMTVTVSSMSLAALLSPLSPDPSRLAFWSGWGKALALLLGGLAVLHWLSREAWGGRASRDRLLGMAGYSLLPAAFALPFALGAHSSFTTALFARAGLLYSAVLLVCGFLAVEDFDWQSVSLPYLRLGDFLSAWGRVLFVPRRLFRELRDHQGPVVNSWLFAPALAAILAAGALEWAWRIMGRSFLGRSPFPQLALFGQVEVTALLLGFAVSVLIWMVGRRLGSRASLGQCFGAVGLCGLVWSAVGLPALLLRGVWADQETAHRVALIGGATWALCLLTYGFYKVSRFPVFRWRAAAPVGAVCALIGLWVGLSAFSRTRVYRDLSELQRLRWRVLTSSGNARWQAQWDVTKWLLAHNREHEAAGILRDLVAPGRDQRPTRRGIRYSEAIQYLADIELHRGHLAEAEQLYQRLWDQPGDDDGRVLALRGWARVAEMRGQYQNALALYYECCIRFPTNRYTTAAAEYVRDHTQ